MYIIEHLSFNTRSFLWNVLFVNSGFDLVQHPRMKLYD